MVEKLVPALQLTEEEIAASAVRHLAREGISARYIPLDELPSSSLPDWIEFEEGGWVLMLPGESFDEAMVSLEALMGYSPD